jgi:hypothetical protein
VEKIMIITRNECCNCATSTFPCIGKRCPLQNQKVYICDDCKDEVDELYEFEGEELCIDCIKKRLKVVE